MSKTNQNDKRQQNLLQIREERENLLRPDSDFFLREAYNTLRTNVTFSMTEESSCHIVAVTSSLQTEGKSITAANLALSYAEITDRVLLIDCDLRRPKLGRLFNLRSTTGLSDLLMKPELLESAIHTVDRGLNVILAGSIPPNPSELHGSVRMKKLLTYLRTKYDYIILDTPPVTMVTDATVLASGADGVLFVVRVGQSERPAVAHAIDQIQYAKIKILGFVLNGVDLGHGTYGYRYRYRKYGYGYKRYGYGYGYGYGSQSAANNTDIRGNAQEYDDVEFGIDNKTAQKAATSAQAEYDTGDPESAPNDDK